LLGEVQSVIKPLGRILGKLKGISGSTILGDGRVAMILDVVSLMDVMAGREEERIKKAMSPNINTENENLAELDAVELAEIKTEVAGQV